MIEVSIHEVFLNVEGFFKFRIKRIPNLNICCSERERKMLIKMVERLKRIYPLLSIKDICIAIIFSYYGLVLGEQTEDYLNTHTYKDYADNKDDVTNLFLSITTGNIMVNGKNLSSEIRREMLGFDAQRGGKNKSKQNKSKQNKSKKNKSKKNKSKKNKSKKINLYY